MSHNNLEAYNLLITVLAVGGNLEISVITRGFDYEDDAETALKQIKEHEPPPYLKYDVIRLYESTAERQIREAREAEINRTAGADPGVDDENGDQDPDADDLEDRGGDEERLPGPDEEDDLEDPDAGGDDEDEDEDSTNPKMRPGIEKRKEWEDDPVVRGAY